MAITLPSLPASYRGVRGWSAERLGKVGNRAGMKCVYKLLLDSDKKRAGVYFKGLTARGAIAMLDIAGYQINVDLASKEISIEAGKYYHLKDDRVFLNLILDTLTFFDVAIDNASLYKAAAPIVVVISAEEAEAIPSFGVF